MSPEPTTPTLELIERVRDYALRLLAGAAREDVLTLADQFKSELCWPKRRDTKQGIICEENIAWARRRSLMKDELAKIVIDVAAICDSHEALREALATAHQERDEMQLLLTQALNGWGAYAKRDRELRDIARLWKESGIGTP
jgi:hypothetical protein